MAAFGTNAVPFLLDRLKGVDSKLELKIAEVATKSGPIPLPFRNADIERLQAVTALIFEPTSEERIALRLRDSATGSYFLAQPDDRAGTIVPFIVRGATNGSQIEAELVYLRPVTAEFLVNTPK